MLGGVCTAWLVLVAPSGAPLDPFATGAQASSPGAPVRGDLIDPFAPPTRRTAVSRSPALDLKDPFAPQATAGRRHEARPIRAPDLADPFAHGVERPLAAPVDDAPCAAPRASNGATVQRPEGVAPRCRPARDRGRPHLRNPFG